MGDEDDDADEGGADLARGRLEEVLAEARGVREQHLLTEPQTHLPRIPGESPPLLFAGKLASTNSLAEQLMVKINNSLTSYRILLTIYYS